MLHRSMEAAEELAGRGISTEVIDLRCLVPLDMQPLIASAQKTGHVLIVEEDNLTGGWGAEVAARLSEAAFFHLDAPITRVAAPDMPTPTAPVLEREYVPSVERVVAAAIHMMAG
jgi:pyruvate/2-oxoglutarate/acetoin dehydrogenase E1 component